jgi:hypothetical protein
MALSPAVHPTLKGPPDDVPQDELVQVALVPSIRQYLSAAFTCPTVTRAMMANMTGVTFATRVKQVCIQERFFFINIRILGLGLALKRTSVLLKPDTRFGAIAANCMQTTSRTVSQLSS